MKKDLKKFIKSLYDDIEKKDKKIKKLVEENKELKEDVNKSDKQVSDLLDMLEKLAETGKAYYFKLQYETFYDDCGGFDKYETTVYYDTKKIDIDNSKFIEIENHMAGDCVD